ncbi:MAG: glycosyltransferase [Bacteroides sp.]|nr:glycosyltransferase [Bacteroides sp.]MCM1378742.1 glycosyltransferase [Bacteroides sp.]MCM1445359.1 glycosyltransferase [Prevotella sp.]
MKRLLFYLTRYPGVGGIERVTSLIVSGLSADYDCTVVSHLSDFTLGKVPEGIRHIQLPEAAYDSPTNREFLNQLLGNNQFDLVIYQDSYAPSERMLTDCCRLAGVPLVVCEHNSPLFVENKRFLEPWYASPRSVMRRVLHPWLMNRERKRKRLLLDSCSKYVLLSERFIPDFARIAGIEPKHHKLTAINNPILPPPISNRSLSEYCKRKEILYVGRLVSEKRVNLILNIWQRICNVLPDWQLTIVGDGPERQRLEQQAATIPRVAFEGFQKPDEYYRRACMMLMTSKFEGWGMTLVEAMQHGCVPIAINTFSSLADIIDPGINGLIISPRENLDSVADRVQALARNPERIAVMSEAARLKSKQFELNNIIKDWKSLIEANC